MFIRDLILKTAYLPVVISDASVRAAQDSCCLALPPLQPLSLSPEKEKGSFSVLNNATYLKFQTS